MRNVKTFIGIVFLVLFAATAVFAAGNLPWNTGKPAIAVQNLKAIAPTATTSRCDTVTGTKGTFKTYTTTGYLGIESDVVDSAGAPVKVKWLVDGKQVAIGPSFSATNNGGTAFSNVAYKPYSSPSKSLDSCIRRQ